MRFCQAFISELYRHIGPDTDVPAGDLGVGAREIGYMMGQYKKLTNRYDGTWTGKGTANGGLAGRTEAYRLRYRILRKRNAETLRRRAGRQDCCSLRLR